MWVFTNINVKVKLYKVKIFNETTYILIFTVIALSGSFGGCQVFSCVYMYSIDVIRIN